MRSSILARCATSALLAPLVALATAVAAFAAPQGCPPDQVGQWSQEYHWFDPAHYNEVTHLALLPTGPEAGSVLLWRNCRC